MNTAMLTSTLRPTARTLLRLTQRPLSTAPSQTEPSWLSSVKRISETDVFPNEYPGQNYMFNWCLNADGVTPLKKSAFRITKPLDLKVAGLELPKSSPLRVDASSERAKMPEAGSDDLPFDTFDESTQRIKDSLSLADSLFCPEGHVPGKRTGVRVITNVKALAPDLMAYLERAPRRDPESQSITCYVYGGGEEFSGYAIEEVEETKEDGSLVAVSVATVVVSGKSPKLERVVAGIELSLEGLEADAAERAEKKAAEQE
ncbi:hypothetical protein HJC23_011795 [Cyclotella cryptica]|uniref:Uncharacterized protein n=1 Tax=Cyclotella cryptica TaxID=29204 RepID=A0ABD3PIB5_9STRA|eukprot:CCRYP_014335-RA/>CCRYP_014335-RA protein AED:0.21 eAED:0.21 QI:0/-1/0/1/-1/1/1/0/258